MKKISILLLNYNGLKFLGPCLEAITQQTYKNIEIVVVDNASSDSSVEFLQGRTDLVLVKNSENFGYAKGNNIGAKKATGDYLLILNNDTQIFPDMVENLVARAQEKAILVPRQILMGEGGKNERTSTGIGVDVFGYPYGTARIFYADGAAIFIAREDFFSLGMFDEESFMFYEDIDLSWRAHLLGYRVIPCPEAQFYHFSGGSAQGGAWKEKKYVTTYFRRFHNEKNVIRNILKNYGFFMIVWALPVLLLLHWGDMFVLLVTGHAKAASCYFKAYAWNVLNIKNTLQKRSEVQKKRVLSDWQILQKMHWTYSKLDYFKIGMPEKFV